MNTKPKPRERWATMTRILEWAEDAWWDDKKILAWIKRMKAVKRDRD